MPRGRVQVAQIESYQPVADFRKTGKTGVINGKNFSWDASGVRSDFASQLISGSTEIVSANDMIQSVLVGDEYHMITNNNVFRFVPAYTNARHGVWAAADILDDVQTTNHSLIPAYLTHFTSFFLNGKGYVNSWNTGCYEVNPTTGSYVRMTSVSVPGFPMDSEPVYAVAETNARAVYLTKTAVYWSHPGEPANLVPSVGGAGFQLLASRISGEPRAMMPYGNGIVIWTTTGALIGEFIGGPLVFRWFQTSTDVRPLSQNACIAMADGTHIALTNLGVYQFANPQNPQLISPLFSEFLREYIRFRTQDTAYAWYSATDGRIFFSMRQSTVDFIETFCLDVALDKWGIFSERHRGMFVYKLDSPTLGYADSGGVTHYLKPIMEGALTREDPAVPGTYLGLNSAIVIGYIRDESLMANGDGVQELTDIVVYHNLDASGVFTLTTEEGWLLVGQVNLVDEGTFDLVGPVTVIDEGYLTDESQISSGYKVYFMSDLNMLDPVTQQNYGEAQASLALRGLNSDTWTGSVTGQYLSIRFEATDPGEAFRINAMDCSLAYAGQVT